MVAGMEQAIETFVSESKELLQEMESELLELEGSDLISPDEEAINSIFRAIHTIKGSAGIFSFDHVIELTHVAETVLDQIRSGKTQLNKQLIEHFLQTRDVTETLVLLAAEKQEPSEKIRKIASNLIKEFKQLVTKTNKSEEQVQTATTNESIKTDTPTSSPYWYISFRPKQTVFQDGLDPMSFIRYLQQMGEIVWLETLSEQLDTLTEFDPELCFLGFELMFDSSANKQEIADVFEFIQNEADIAILPPASSVEDYVSLINALPEENQKLGQILLRAGALTETELSQALNQQEQLRDDNKYSPPLGALVSEQGAVNPNVVEAAVAKQDATIKTRIHQSKTLRVEALKLDRLIDQVGEMVITGARTNLLAHETGDETLIEAMALLERLVENIRDSSLKLRMVQIGETFNKFKRVVRDVSDELGKKVELSIQGADTELDKTFVEKISDPLMHIVRNAIDHGLETPTERQAANKPETGILVLNSYHDSGSIVIEVRDDGKGLNREKILERAIERGIVEPSQTLSEKDINLLIFEPGFSTAEQVTNLSGRGVGMDVVRRNIDSLRGSVEIESTPGQGTQLLIRLPLTLSIIDGFMFQVAQANYVIPLDTVIECLELHEIVDAAEIIDKSYINFRGEVLPFVRLRSLFGCMEKIEHERESLVIVQFGSLRAGLVVDSLKGEFQTVVKPLGRLFEGLKCISGATILGSGEVAIILDVSALIQSAIAAYEKKEAKQV